VVDLRKPEWVEHIVQVLIPKVIAKGFDGVMLDTVESPLELEAENPARFGGMTEAAVKTLRTLRARYPDLVIMLNRGFEILPAVARDIDLFLAESLYTDWQPGEKKPRFVPQAEYLHNLKIIKSAMREAPHLKVYTVDYWPETDRRNIKKIYSTMRAEGFIPYVGSIDLQGIEPEPK
jgi:hypothetical protein